MRNVVAAALAIAGLALSLPASLVAQWAPSGGPEECRVTWDLAVSGTDIYAATDRGVFLSEDGGGTWRKVFSFERKVDKAVADGQGGRPIEESVSLRFERVLACGSDVFAWGDGRLFRSSDRGATWTEIEAPVPSWRMVPLAAGRVNLYFTESLYTQAFISRDRGESWAWIDCPVMANCFYEHGPYLFLGMGGRGHKSPPLSEGGRTAVNSVYRSEDGGRTWRKARFQLSAPVRCLAAVGTDLFVATERGLYLCHDLGACRKASKLKLPADVTVWSLCAVGNALFVRTDRSIYRVRNEGGIWMALDTGWPIEIGSTSLVAAGSDLYAGTRVSGVWRCPVPR